MARVADVEARGGGDRRQTTGRCCPRGPRARWPPFQHGPRHGLKWNKAAFESARSSFQNQVAKLRSSACARPGKPLCSLKSRSWIS